MKATAITAILIALLGTLTAGAAPKSSATFDKALGDAEMLAALNPAWSVHRTSGESMGEFFGDNSLILVQTASIKEIAVGMMIVYRSTDGELISHKVVEHNGDHLRTKGSANWNLDPEPVTAEMVVGTIFAVFHAAAAPSGELFASDGAPIPTAFCKSY